MTERKFLRADGDRIANRRAGEADVMIGSRIRSARSAAGLTLEELASRLAVSTQQLHKYETGGTRITVSRLMQVSDALHVDLETLLDLSQRPAVASPLPGPSPADMVHLVSTFCGLRNPTSRAKIIELAEFLKSFEAEGQAS